MISKILDLMNLMLDDFCKVSVGYKNKNVVFDFVGIAKKSYY